jgi:CheY-specific phosphatase CheX
MTLAANKPDLRCIGAGAVTEVLGTLLSLAAAVADSASQALSGGEPDLITSRVGLTGPRISGSVMVQFPEAFLTMAVRRLTGAEVGTGDPTALRDDAAGELANMVAGRVATQLAAVGFPCNLGTPALSRGGFPRIESDPGLDRGLIEFLCDGQRLSLEIRCRYVVS